ncbi:hypothetical protein BN2475_270083 [Paraburkholderia ribeironis]|uniref:Uncharacterized protein n=1 Tax=Paraburkholderia ribeironis TaxID=1247936 RepID=A0A1N7S089_9BURK|nr:hypothetical protein BN2475_270083 [Paraburkholderia ribeironis]
MKVLSRVAGVGNQLYPKTPGGLTRLEIRVAVAVVVVAAVGTDSPRNGRSARSA